jgi:hypothetical protein
VGRFPSDLPKDVGGNLPPRPRTHYVGLDFKLLTWLLIAGFDLRVWLEGLGVALAEEVGAYPYQGHCPQRGDAELRPG